MKMKPLKSNVYNPFIKKHLKICHFNFIKGYPLNLELIPSIYRKQKCTSVEDQFIIYIWHIYLEWFGYWGACNLHRVSKNCFFLGTMCRGLAYGKSELRIISSWETLPWHLPNWRDPDIVLGGPGVVLIRDVNVFIFWKTIFSLRKRRRKI